MEHYVTLFDSLFLPQGLVLHKSMERHLGNYTLWILCVDDNTFNSLVKLNLPNVKLLQLSALETDELKQVKTSRTTGEYCWTLTPFAPRFVFEADSNVQRVTYLDADLYFMKCPKPIFAEFESSGKSVLITDHAYAPAYDQSEINGQYCVQFMTFNREGGELVRKWWEERCVEWCYARSEDGKFGDQKYLDDWPECFPNTVHVLNNKELALAPWNATRFPYSNGVFWHFHELRISLKRSKFIVSFGPYPLPNPTLQYVYNPYLDDLRNAVNLLVEHEIEVKTQRVYSLIDRIMSVLRGMYHQLWKMNENRKVNL